VSGRDVRRYGVTRIHPEYVCINYRQREEKVDDETALVSPFIKKKKKRASEARRASAAGAVSFDP